MQIAIDLVALCDICVLETPPVDKIWPFSVLTKILPTTLRLPITPINDNPLCLYKQ